MSLGRSVTRWLGGLVLVVVVLSFASPAAAHTDFESSSPADGEVLDAPVVEIVIRFTGEATPAGEGFTILDPDGVVRSPSSVTTEDNRVFVLRVDPPLAGGSVGVRWMVQARDAHPIDGSFSFTVPAPAVTTSTTSPPITAPPSTSGAPTTTSVPATSVPAVVGDDSSGEGDSLDEFLAMESTTPGQGRQLVGRILAYVGMIGAVGGLAFLATALRGTRREIDGLLAAIAGLGALVVLGAATELWGWLAQSSGSVTEELTSTPGLAMVVRIAGGVVLAGSLAYGLATHRAGSTAPVARPLSASVAVHTEATDAGHPELQRWSPRHAPLAIVGAALLVASFWFDGHTTSEGPRVVHVLVNTVHVVAAAVWAGGVMALASIVVGRHRRGVPTRSAELLVRFSSIAAVSLAAVALAGGLLAVFVLDDLGELTSTEWGRILLLKTGVVGLAALGGAYNHFKLRPALEASPEDPRLESEFRRTLVGEAVVLLVVIVITGWLVAAAT